jgi:polysaccharide deacetylase 2 family uncharacterized protein YibQ
VAKKKSTRKSTKASSWSIRKRGSAAGAKKRKAAAKRRRTSGAVPPRILTMLVLLALLGAAGIASVKYLQSPAGHASLLDKGLGDYYPQVQKAIDAELRATLEVKHLDGLLSEMAVRNTWGQGAGPYEWFIHLPEEADFIDINLALTEAVKRGGGRVRESVERDGGRNLFMDFGSWGHSTHRVTLSKNRPKKLGDRAPQAGRAKQRSSSGDAEKHVGTGSGGEPRIAIVIDDFGYARNGVARSLIEMNLPLSISILPGLPHTRNVLAMARDAGRCTLLHLPMQAEELDQKPDTDPVRTDMSEAEIRELVEGYLDGMDGVDGVNNHQGSLATADSRVMEATLGPVRDRDLFFLDSLTSPKSVAYNTARELGVPTARNTIFLDDDTEDAAVVEERLVELLRMATRSGSAVGIGHPHRWTLEALENSRALLRDYGVELVPVCELVQ